MIYWLPERDNEREVSMGYLSKVQVIQRGGKNRQYYLICPAPLAQALEMEKGEAVEWVVEDKWTITLRRVETKGANVGRRGGR
jgi:hypothetical protein